MNHPTGVRTGVRTGVANRSREPESRTGILRTETDVRDGTNGESTHPPQPWVKVRTAHARTANRVDGGAIHRPAAPRPRLIRAAETGGRPDNPCPTCGRRCQPRGDDPADRQPGQVHRLRDGHEALALTAALAKLDAAPRTASIHTEDGYVTSPPPEFTAKAEALATALWGKYPTEMEVFEAGTMLAGLVRATVTYDEYPEDLWLHPCGHVEVGNVAASNAGCEGSDCRDPEAPWRPLWAGPEVCMRCNGHGDIVDGSGGATECPRCSGTGDRPEESPEYGRLSTTPPTDTEEATDA